MGATFGQMILRINGGRTLDALKATRNMYSISISPSVFALFDEASSRSYSSQLCFAKEIAKDFDLVWTNFVYDDSVYEYTLFMNGEAIDSYNSSPSFFVTSSPGIKPPEGGNAGQLCAAFGVHSREAVKKAHEILRYEKPDVLEGETEVLPEMLYVFETERYAEILRVLGLPECLSGASYHSLMVDPDCGSFVARRV